MIVAIFFYFNKKRKKVSPLENDTKIVSIKQKKLHYRQKSVITFILSHWYYSFPCKNIVRNDVQ